MLTTYAGLDSGIALVPVTSAVMSKRNRAIYTLSILVTSPKGDTLKQYRKTRIMMFLNDNDMINEAITLKRYAQTTHPAVIAGRH